MNPQLSPRSPVIAPCISWVWWSRSGKRWGWGELRREGSFGLCCIRMLVHPLQILLLRRLVCSTMYPLVFIYATVFYSSPILQCHNLLAYISQLSLKNIWKQGLNLSRWRRGRSLYWGYCCRRRCWGRLLTHQITNGASSQERSYTPLTWEYI